MSTRVNLFGEGDPDLALRRWAECGAMSLTGTADGPPLAQMARIALSCDALAEHLNEISCRIGNPVQIDGAALLGERAAIAGLSRQGATSCGGASRLLAAEDGWIAVSLARPTDIELLAAWLEQSLGIASATPLTDQAWELIGDIVGRRSASQLTRQAVLLGLPCAVLGSLTAARSVVRTQSVEMAARPTRRLEELLVVDLSALWAGPLCANLLGLAGARVVKVESTTRPDGARYGPPEFYDLLHGGHESVALNFAEHADRQMLRALLMRADVVIEASRPRALENLGLPFETLRDAGWRGVWISITGHGRDQPQRVAFGDDAAVAGGLVGHYNGSPVFCSDAIADPITGLLGAALTVDALDRGVTGLFDLSLAHTAAHLHASIGRFPLIAVVAGTFAAAPRARAPIAPAASLGADTDSVLREL